MRIVQFVENLDRGGLERVAVDLATELARRGHELSFVCLHEPGALALEAEAAGLKVYALRKPPGFSPRVLTAAILLLRQIRPDVVHTHNGGVHHYAAVASRLSGTRCVICTRHGPLSSTGAPYNERWFRAVLPWTDRIAHVSDHTRRHLVDQSGLPAGKSLVVYNGISLERHRNRPASPAVRYPRLCLGSLGRMVPVKGHKLLIDAFSRVAAELPELTLRITGGGPLQQELTAQVAMLGLRDRISIESLNPDGPGVLAGLDAFIFPSLSEGLPLVILEAMAAGLPIIATAVGGVPEVAPEGEVAWYCPPGDAGALAALLRQAVQSPSELSRRGAAARKLAFSRYGLEHMTNRYEDLYREILSRKEV